MDRRPNGDSRAAHRRPGHGVQRSRLPGGEVRAGVGGMDGRGSRHHHGGHRHSGLPVSVLRVRAAGETAGGERGRIRHQRRLHRVHLWAQTGQGPDSVRSIAARAPGRGRDLEPHHRLPGSVDLRPLRRRRGGGVHRGFRGTGEGHHFRGHRFRRRRGRSPLYARRRLAAPRHRTRPWISGCTT